MKLEVTFPKYISTTPHFNIFTFTAYVMSTAIMEGDENIGVVNSPRLNRKANVLQPSTVHNIQGSPKVCHCVDM